MRLREKVIYFGAFTFLVVSMTGIWAFHRMKEAQIEFMEGLRNERAALEETFEAEVAKLRAKEERAIEIHREMKEVWKEGFVAARESRKREERNFYKKMKEPDFWERF